MSEQLTKKPEITLHRVGDAKPLESGAIEITINVTKDEVQTIQVTHPGTGLLEDPLFLSGAIGAYGQANNIDELDAANPQYGRTFLKLFTVIANYPNTDLVAIDFTNPTTPRFLLATDKGVVYGWTESEGEKVFVATEQGAELPKESIFHPSELLYAFSIVAESARLGSNRFTVLFDGESGNVTVSFFDHEVQAHRSNICFPKMRISEETPVVH